MSADQFRPLAAHNLYSGNEPYRGPVPAASAGRSGAAAGGAAGMGGAATMAGGGAPFAGSDHSFSLHDAFGSDVLTEAFRSGSQIVAEKTAAAQSALPVAFQSVQRLTEKEEAAREAGYSAGYAAGWAAATREETEAIARRIQERTEKEQEAVARLTQMRNSLMMARETARSMASPELQMNADEITMAAISLAEELVGVFLRDERRRIAAALERALAVEEEAGVVRIRMHPDDVAFYGELAADPEVRAAIPEGVDLIADPLLEPGDAVTELEVGYVDARLSSAMERVRAEIIETPTENAER